MSPPPPPDLKDFEKLFAELFGGRSKAKRATTPTGLEVLRARLGLSARQRAHGGRFRLRVDWDGAHTRVTVTVPPNTQRGAVLRLRGVHVATRTFDVLARVEDPRLDEWLLRPHVGAAVVLLIVLFAILANR